MPRNRPEPPDLTPIATPLDFINNVRLRPNPLFKIVVTPKNVPDDSILRSQLIELTERLAREAKDGTLKGIGGFADYGKGYIFGLEGSYLEHPDTAILPLKRLDKRVMDQIELIEKDE